MLTPQSAIAKWCPLFRTVHVSALVRLLRGSSGLVMLVLAGFYPAQAEEAPADRGILLVLNSYGSEYEWTRNQVDGMRHSLANTVLEEEIYYEYLDGKRVSWDHGFGGFLDHLQEKYVGRDFMAIAVTDDIALKCAVELREQLEYDIPIFFSGINVGGRDAEFDLGNATGILEYLDFRTVVPLVHELFPRVKQIHVLSEFTEVGNISYREFLQEMAFFPGIHVHRIEPKRVEELKVDFAHFTEDSLVVILSYSRDGEGNVVVQSRVVNELAGCCPVPVLVHFDFSLCENVLGGFVLDSYHMGELLGDQIKAYVEGMPLAQIQSQRSYPHWWAFSALGLKKFGIKKSSLPEGARILYQGPGISRTVWFILAILAVFLVIQGFTIVLLQRSRRRLKGTSEELRGNRNQLESWLLHAPVSISVFKTNGKTVLVNERFTHLLGYQSSDFRNAAEMWRVLIQDEEKRAFFLQRWNSRFENIGLGYLQAEEVTVTCNFGQTKILETHMSKVGDYWICLHNDVTLRSQVERELELALNQTFKANVAKTQFLANMSHEIRTPLNGVLGMAQLLSETEMDEEQQSFLATIQKSGEVLLRTINDILDISKIEAGSMKMESIPFDLRSTIKDSIDVCLPKLDSGKVKFKSSVDKEVPAILVGDPFRVGQIVTNLLSNAFKYTSEGSVELLVRASRQLTKNGTCRCSIIVKDTGIGISLEKQAAIFDPFIQADTSNTRQYGGTGLGLTICNRLAQKMGGKISVVSHPEEGSEFTFTWSPECPQEGVTRKNNATPIATGCVALDAFGVLVVEDNPINRKVIELSLRKNGIPITKACNGVEALLALKERRFELVFMDIQMPEMDGLKCTEKIRSTFPEEQQPFIIALTAHAMAEHMEQCRKAGMNGFLSKPYTNDELRSALNLFHEKRFQSWKACYF